MKWRCIICHKSEGRACETSVPSGMSKPMLVRVNECLNKDRTAHWVEWGE